MIMVGFVLGLMKLLEIDVNSLPIPYLGTVFGITGTVLSITLMVMSKKFIQDDK